MTMAAAGHQHRQVAMRAMVVALMMLIALMTTAGVPMTRGAGADVMAVMMRAAGATLGRRLMP